MKICNVVAILSISCLLPILAQKQDNAIDTTGLTCENELGQCIDKNDTHQCMFPLAKLDCPAGKECCKTFPKEYDSAALPLTKAKKCTKKCPCCIARMTDTMTNMEATLNSTQELLDSKPSKNELQSLIESNCFDSESKFSEMTRDINGMTDTMKNMEATLNSTQELLNSKPSKNELQSLIESNCFDSESKLSEMTRDINGMTDTMTNVEDTLKSTQEVLDSKPSKNELQSLIESNCFVSESKFSEMTRDINGVDEKITNLESAMKDQFTLLNCAMKGYPMAYGDSCYFISSSKETWSNAQAKCVNMGGNLVKIDNDEEFSFIQDQVTDLTWIGLNDIAHEGQYTWISDGSSHNLKQHRHWWKSGEPNNFNNEDCVCIWELHSQTLLNDGVCSWSFSYICEM